MCLDDIIHICSKYSITDYKVNGDLSIDVNNDVNLTLLNLNELPLTFNEVNGIFNCSFNSLTSLKGCPRKCITLNASYNKINNLDYLPIEVENILLNYNHLNIECIDIPKSTNLLSIINNPIYNICKIDHIPNKIVLDINKLDLYKIEYELLCKLNYMYNTSVYSKDLNDAFNIRRREHIIDSILYST